MSELRANAEVCATPDLEGKCADGFAAAWTEVMDSDLYTFKPTL